MTGALDGGTLFTLPRVGPGFVQGLASESAIKPRHRWEDSFPEDGLILNVIARDLPEQCDPLARREVKWNQDYAWFSRDEGRQWLGDDPRPGSVHRLPPKLIDRLARFHLVDNVKGQTETFPREGIEGSSISTRVLERTGSSVRLEIAGQTRGVAAEGWWQSGNAVVTRVLGSATFDLDAGKFTAFEMLALGRRWGYTRYNGRRRDPESGPIGYVFRLASPDAPRIAPARISRYDAPWVRAPGRR